MEGSTAGQPAAAPVVAIERGAGQSALATDLAVAGAAAQAVRAMPEVADLSPGIAIPAATYGAGQRVTGVVVHHLAPDVVGIEIHVVLSEAQCRAAAASAPANATERPAEEIGLLAGAANHIREVVYAALREAAPPTLKQVDVLIDDLR